jgi:hypothetical protein
MFNAFGHVERLYVIAVAVSEEDHLMVARK